MKEIKYSIVTVCLNPGESLKKTVSSICEQTYDNWELIIKDGLSKDGSIAELGKLDKRVQIIKKEDKGIYDAMNQALELISGDRIIFLNAGDVFASNSVLEEVSKYAINNENKVIYGDYRNSFGDVCVQPNRITDLFMYSSFLCHQSVLYPSAAKIRYDDRYKILGDHDLHLSLFREGIEFAHIPVVICEYEGGGISENAKYKEIYAFEKEDILKKYYFPIERKKYALIHILSFPKIRRYLCRSERTRKIYRKLATFLRRAR